MRKDPAAFGAWLLFFLGALRAQQRSLEPKLQVERELMEVSSVQQRIADFVTTRGGASSSDIGRELGLKPRAVRYHLGILIERGILAPRGEYKGRYYVPSGDKDSERTPRSPLGGTNAVIAEIFERGSRISRTDLINLVRKHGYDPRTVGVLHARRLAHLRRDPRTGESVLTARGEEVARQYLFAARLARSKDERDAM